MLSPRQRRQVASIEKKSRLYVAGLRKSDIIYGVRLLPQSLDSPQSLDLPIRVLDRNSTLGIRDWLEPPESPLREKRTPTVLTHFCTAPQSTSQHDLTIFCQHVAQHLSNLPMLVNIAQFYPLKINIDKVRLFRNHWIHLIVIEYTCLKCFIMFA